MLKFYLFQNNMLSGINIFTDFCSFCYLGQLLTGLILGIHNFMFFTIFSYSNMLMPRNIADIFFSFNEPLIQ